MLVLAGWPDHEPPEGGWRGADLTGRALLLAHMSPHGQPSPPVGTTEDQSVCAVLAGRLYNRRELTVALGGRHSLSGREDAEIVAHLYEERGLKCVKALRGAFALALWDARRGRLLLARDHLGLVPLYFAADGHRLAASSALRALTALPGVAQAWDAAALDAFLTFGFIPPPGTAKNRHHFTFYKRFYFFKNLLKTFRRVGVINNHVKILALVHAGHAALN